MHLTIAIATWNRADRLRLTLDALRDVDLVEGVICDAVVCDNNSTDHTRTMVEEQIESWREQHGERFTLRYLFEPTQGKSHALNRIIRETQGDWLLFLDDDVKPEAGWLNAYVEGMQRYPDAAFLGGAITPWLEKTPGKRGQFLLREYPVMFGVLKLEQDTLMSQDHTAWGANMALRRSTLGSDPFDASRGMIGGVRIAGEDVGVMQDLMKAGHQGWLLAAARVGHFIPAKQLSLRRFWSWNKGLGRAWIIARGHPQPGKFGVAWWAWKEYVRRCLIMAVRWRPWSTRGFFDASGNAAQYFGYLTAPRTEPETQPA